MITYKLIVGNTYKLINIPFGKYRQNFIQSLKIGKKFLKKLIFCHFFPSQTEILHTHPTPRATIDNIYLPLDHSLDGIFRRMAFNGRLRRPLTPDDSNPSNETVSPKTYPYRLRY